MAQGVRGSGALRNGRKVENRKRNHAALDALRLAQVTDKNVARRRARGKALLLRRLARCAISLKSTLVNILPLHALEGYGSVAQSTESTREAPQGEYTASPKAKKLPAELLRVNAQDPESEVLRYAASFLSRGSVVAIPTDTFYGLAADPFNLAAVDEIYRVKGRPETRALPILVRSLEQAMQLAREVPQNFLRLAQEFWPGALTLVVDAAMRLPLKVTANTGKVALRWPKSDVARRLIDEFDGPITGTSANISGFPSCSNAEQLMKQLGSRVPLILDGGETGALLGSTIVHLHGGAWKIIREGAIPVAEIEKALK
jgi:tRNA threonylcarbamoyl adenosine modification protein (Sua5/YciO/YrdC/YwlC family)